MRDERQVVRASRIGFAGELAGLRGQPALERTRRGRFGAGATHTWRGLNETRSEGTVGLDITWNLSDTDNVLLTNNYFHDLGNTSDLRLLTSLTWNVALAYLKGLGIQLGIDNEYDTRRITDENNLKYYANVTYDF